jgi:hypothetical protein
MENTERGFDFEYWHTGKNDGVRSGIGTRKCLWNNWYRHDCFTIHQSVICEITKQTNLLN